MICWMSNYNRLFFMHISSTPFSFHQLTLIKVFIVNILEYTSSCWLFFPQLWIYKLTFHHVSNRHCLWDGIWTWLDHNNSCHRLLSFPHPSYWQTGLRLWNDKCWVMKTKIINEKTFSLKQLLIPWKKPERLVHHCHEFSI